MYLAVVFFKIQGTCCPKVWGSKGACCLENMLRGYIDFHFLVLVDNVLLYSFYFLNFVFYSFPECSIVYRSDLLDIQKMIRNT